MTEMAAIGIDLDDPSTWAKALAELAKPSAARASDALTTNFFI
jgi:hypothetical protein